MNPRAIILHLLIGSLWLPTHAAQVQKNAIEKPVKVLGNPDTADIDGLLTDIQNHNRQLADVIASKDTPEVKKEAIALREDVKSLVRKSTGLSATESAQLQQKMNQIIDVTERLEKKAEASDYGAVKGHYEKLQPIVKSIQGVGGKPRQVRERTSATSPEQVAVGSEVQRLLTDINNHNTRIRELISAKDFAVIKKESVQLREDVKALVKNSTELSQEDQTRLEQRMNHIVDLTERIERNADQSDASDLRSLEQKLQAQIKNIQKLVTGTAEKNR